MQIRTTLASAAATNVCEDAATITPWFCDDDWWIRWLSASHGDRPLERGKFWDRVAAVPRGRFDHDNAHARLRRATTVSMSDTVTAIVGHSLGKVEAIRRLKEGFSRTNGHLGAMIAMEQETWEGDTVRFRMRALGQTAAASIEVLEDALRIEVSLPWLVAKVAKRLLPILREEATLLLEKK